MYVIHTFFTIFVYIKIKNMKIYTSYYGNLKKLKTKNITPIGTSLGTPKWFFGPMLKTVAPTPLTLKLRTEGEYIKSYEKHTLNKLNLASFLNNLKSLSQNKDIALLCYEKSNEFCHRHLLAEWLEKKLNITIEEFGEGKVERKNGKIIPKKNNQVSLFQND